MRRILIVGTGGTVASRQSGSDGAVATDSASTLVASLGTVPDDIRVETLDIERRNSFNLDLRAMRGIAAAVACAFERDDLDGVVVAHGTDTLEETAMLLDLVHADDRPIVLTGAQISADRADSDGPSNLRDAVVVAASDVIAGHGALVVFGGQLLAARGVRKQHTLDPRPFAGVGGVVGSVHGDEVTVVRRPSRSIVLPRPSPAFDDRRVDAVLTYPGVDDVQLHGALRAGAAGIVVVGTGAGNPGSGLLPALHAAASSGIAVVLASRVPEGPVAAIYGGGGAAEAVALGLTLAGELPASQARIALAMLLDVAPATWRETFAAICDDLAPSPRSTAPPQEGRS